MHFNLNDWNSYANQETGEQKDANSSGPDRSQILRRLDEKLSLVQDEDILIWFPVRPGFSYFPAWEPGLTARIPPSSISNDFTELPSVTILKYSKAAVLAERR